jgi:hypothetical protein
MEGADLTGVKIPTLMFVTSNGWADQIKNTLPSFKIRELYFIYIFKA